MGTVKVKIFALAVPCDFMAHCYNCDAHVTDSFRRVFSGNDGIVNGCPDCMTYSEIHDGDPARDTDEGVTWR